MSSVVDQVAEVRATRKRAAQARVEELARLAAEGEQVDPVEVADTTTAAGLDDSWFAAQIAHREKRRPLLAAVAKRPAFEPQRARPKRRWPKSAKSWRRLPASVTRSLPPPKPSSTKRCARISGRRLQAAADLRRGCKCPEIIGRLNEVGREVVQPSKSGCRSPAQAASDRGQAKSSGLNRSEYHEIRERRPAFSARYPTGSTMREPWHYDAQQHAADTAALEPSG